MNSDTRGLLFKIVGGMLLAFFLVSGGAWVERIIGGQQENQRLERIENVMEDLIVRLRHVESRLDVQDERWAFVSDQLARIQESVDRVESSR